MILECARTQAIIISSTMSAYASWMKLSALNPEEREMLKSKWREIMTYSVNIVQGCHKFTGANSGGRSYLTSGKYGQVRVYRFPDNGGSFRCSAHIVSLFVKGHSGPRVNDRSSHLCHKPLCVRRSHLCFESLSDNMKRQQCKSSCSCGLVPKCFPPRR